MATMKLKDSELGGATLRETYEAQNGEPQEGEDVHAIIEPGDPSD